MTKYQIEHIKEHLTAFKELTATEIMEEYSKDHSHVEDRYEYLCSELGIEPIRASGLTDTQRLDWVMAHQPEFDGDSNNRWWMRWCENSHWNVARSNKETYREAWRECVDKAIGENIATL